SAINLHPVHAEPTRDGEPRLVGYRVGNMVTVVVRAVDTLGATLDRVVKAGGNQVHGITFGFSDPTALQDQARERAMQDARRKAEQLARLAGATLGAVQRVEAVEGGEPRPMMGGRMMA